MDEIKVLLQSLVEKALCAKNAKDEDEEKEEKAENKKACNEEVDKRDIIRQIMAIAGKEEASEDVKTIAKLAEKLAYDKSEAGTADNCKAKNEEDEDKKEDKKAENEESAEAEEKFEELKEDVDKEAANKKAKNAIDEAVNTVLEAINSNAAPVSNYQSQSERLELGNKY